MRENVRRIDIEKSTGETFKQKDYKDKGFIPVVILENGKEVDLSNYRAKVLFEISNEEINEKQCEIIDNMIKVNIENFGNIKTTIPFEIVLNGNNQRVTTFVMYLKK